MTEETMIKYSQKGSVNILLLIILIVGLAVGVWLVQNSRTNLKSSASGNITSALDIRDANGKEVKCLQNASGIPECEIETLDFTVAVKDPSLLPQ